MYAKKHIFILLLLVLSKVAFPQGINFVHNLDEAIILAKKENKLIFIDFYTSWCAPCKMMSNEVFPQKEVGDYFNTNFISVKIQCDDKGIGAELGKKFTVSAYPTLMFLDSGQHVIHSTAGGLYAKQLIELAKIASDPNSNQLKLVKEWEAGNRTHDFAKKYFFTLMQSYRVEKANNDFEKYFESLSDSEKASKNTFELMQILNVAPFTPSFEYMELNKKNYERTIGKTTLDSIIAKTYLWYFKRLQSIGLSNNDLKEFDLKMQRFKSKKYSFYKEYAQFYNVFDSRDANGKENIERYIERGNDFLTEYGMKNDEYTIAISHMLGNLTSRKNQTTIGIQWMEDLIARNNNPKYLNTYFYITWRNYQWDKALKIAEKIKVNAIAENKSTETADKNIQMIKELKIKYPDQP